MSFSRNPRQRTRIRFYAKKINKSAATRKVSVGTRASSKGTQRSLPRDAADLRAKSNNISNIRPERSYIGRDPLDPVASDRIKNPTDSYIIISLMYVYEVYCPRSVI